MPTPNTEATTRLPNSEAIRQFNAKIPHIGQIKAYQHALAFSVAGIAKKDMLSDIHTAISQAIEGGIAFDEFKKQLIPYLTAKGWTDSKAQLGGYRLQLIFDTNKKTAYAAGRWERLQRTKKTFPYLQYMPSVCAQKRHEHKQYYGLIAHIDDPIWQSIYPPNGFNCRCSVRVLTQKQAETLLAKQQADGLSFDKSVNAVTPSFRANHDRLSAMLKLAEDKHGGGFGDRLKQDLGWYMVDYAGDRGVKVADFGGIIPRQREIERLMAEGVRQSEAQLTDQWQQHYRVKIVGFEQGVHKMINPPNPPDLAQVDSDLPTNKWLTLDIMYTLESQANPIEFNRSFHKSHKSWEKATKNIIKHIQKADIVPMYLDHMDTETIVKIVCFVLSLTKEQQKKVVFVWGNKT